MIELRRRRVVQRRPRTAERLAGQEAISHQRPGVVDESGAQARDQRPEAELNINEERESRRGDDETARGRRARPRT